MISPPYGKIWINVSTVLFYGVLGKVINCNATVSYDVVMVVAQW